MLFFCSFFRSRSCSTFNLLLLLPAFAAAFGCGL